MHVTIHLAAEDPRLADFENLLAKLKRVVPRVDVTYAATSRSGLFESANDRYGEIWYEIGGRKSMNRAATPAIALDVIYRLAGISPPPRDSSPGFAGHPLAANPARAAWAFNLFWPSAIAAAWRFHTKE